MEKNNLENYDNCPICGERFVIRCKCFKADSRCKNGHKWHRCLLHDKTVIGKESDHSKDINSCSC